MIYQELSEYTFAYILSRNEDNGFSFAGATALHGYLEELSEGVGEDIEFDAVALRCEYSEYETYREYAGTIGWKPRGEEAEEEDREGEAREYAERHGDVVAEFDGGIVVRDS